MVAVVFAVIFATTSTAAQFDNEQRRTYLVGVRDEGTFVRFAVDGTVKAAQKPRALTNLRILSVQLTTEEAAAYRADPDVRYVQEPVTYHPLRQYIRRR